jgi:hypothetical protein
MARLLALVALLSLLASNTAYAEPRVERAHHKKVAAAALIGVGSALAVAGQILLIVAAVDKQFYGAEVHCGPMGGCGSHPSLYEPFAIPGGVLVGGGAAMLITGIPLYAVGGAEMRRAERTGPTLSFAPQFGRDGGTLVARLRF